MRIADLAVSATNPKGHSCFRPREVSWDSSTEATCKKRIYAFGHFFEAEKLKKLTDSVDETGDGDLVKTVSPFPIRR